MRRMKAAPWIWIALSGACAATAPVSGPNGAASVSASRMEREVHPDPAAPIEASTPGRTEHGPMTPAPDSELALWNDPAFRARFVESYLSETEVEPRVTAAEREQLQEVLDLIASDRPDKALLLLEKPGGPTTSAVFDFIRANLYFQRERLDEAGEAYDAAVEAHPKFRRAWKNLGLVQVRRGDFPRAARALTRVIELGGGDATTYGLLGYAHSNLGNHLSAETAYRMATLLDPDTADWKTGLARSFFKQERYAEAAALCGNLLAEQPERSDLWLLQANAYIGLNQPRAAAENYEIVERLGKSSADSLNMLGDIYVNEELFDLAVDAYARALEQHPDSDPGRALRAAKALTAHGALQETRALVARLEDLRGSGLVTGDAPLGSPRGLDEAQHKDLLKLRARLAVADGAQEEEARVLEEIVALDPLDGEALLLLGQHEARAGEDEKAVFYYERAASLEAFEAEAKVRHAQLLVGKRRYAEALPLLRRSQALNPRDSVREYLEQVERMAQTR